MAWTPTSSTQALDSRSSDSDVYLHALDWKGVAAARQVHSLLNHDRPELRRALEDVASVRAATREIGLCNTGDGPEGYPKGATAGCLRAGELGGLACSPNRRRSNERTVPASRPARNCSGIARGGGPGRPHRIRTLQLRPRKERGRCGASPDSRVRRARRDRPVVCVALGAYLPIHNAIVTWREALLAHEADALRRAAFALSRLVWEPLRPHLADVRKIACGA